MKFSIVTPAYNASRYLPEMLESVSRQSFADWELRIVDDGSSDDTPRIIRDAAAGDRRIKPIYLPHNSGGCFVPRRVAIEASEGEYIVNIDADDTVEPDYLLKLDRRIGETGADLVYANMVVVSESGSHKFLPREKAVYAKVCQGRDIFRMALDEWEVSGVTATKRSLALESLKLFDSSGIASDKGWDNFDNENLTRIDLFLSRKTAFCDTDYYYRQAQDSITHGISLRRFGLLSSDMRLCEFVGNTFGPESTEYVLAQRQLFHHVIESIRLLNSNPGLDKAGQANRLVREAFGSIERSLLNGHVSPRYLAITRLGFPITKFILSIYGGRKG